MCQFRTRLTYQKYFNTNVSHKMPGDNYHTSGEGLVNRISIYISREIERLLN